MTRTLSPLLVGLLFSAAARADVAALEKAVQEAIRKAEPSVACILVSRSAEYRKFNPVRDKEEPGVLGDFPRIDNDKDERARLDMSHPDYVPESYGSGIIIDRGGLILTTAHVVQGAVKVFVRLPGGAGSYADIHALDARCDLAVLRLQRPPRDLKTITIGDGDTVKKGQFVVGIANPYAAGFREGSPTASLGIVGNLRRRAVNLNSEKDRRRLTLPQFATLLQSDVKLHAGCSGGALINLQGEMIGITTAQAALTGVDTPGGFALPTGEGVRRIIESLRKGEEVEYGFLGVTFQNGERAAKISDAIEKSPAQLAGLRTGDYLLAVNGQPIHDTDDVFVHIGSMLAGSTVEIERARTPEGPGDKVRVTLAKYYHQQESLASKRPPAVGGLRVDHASLAVQRGVIPLDGVPTGVLIREVEPGSPAERAKLQPDKFIVAVNGKAVTSPTQFLRAIEKLRGKVELTVQRLDGGTDQVTLDLTP